MTCQGPTDYDIYDHPYILLRRRCWRNAPTCRALLRCAQSSRRSRLAPCGRLPAVKPQTAATTATSLMAALALAMPLSVAAQPARTEPHRKLLVIALDNLARARCERGQPCAPATAEERATPPITDDPARVVVEAGSISVIAEHCGLDWQRRNFEPLMKHHRERLRMSERQLALVSLLHGIAMGLVGESVRRTPCSPELKVSTEKRLIAP
jgi:hypothetical protein